jgi:hypothetical protein
MNGYPPPPGYNPAAAPQAPAAPGYAAPPQYAPPAPPAQFMPPGHQMPPQAPPGYGAAPYAPPPAPYGAPPMGAPPAPANALAGLGGAQLFAQGEYFPIAYAEYDIKIVDTILKSSVKSGTVIVVEVEIVSGAAQTPQDTLPAGTKRGIVVKISNANVARQQLLEMMAALLGYDRRNAEHLQAINTQLAPQVEKFWQEICQTKSCNGKVIHVSTSPHTTKENKKQITKMIYTPKTAR